MWKYVKNVFNCLKLIQLQAHESDISVHWKKIADNTSLMCTQNLDLILGS